MRTRNKTQARRNTRKIKTKKMRRIKGIEEGNKEAMRQTQRERYKRDKDKINAKTKRKAKTEERRTTTNQPKAIHAYYIFYSFHLVYSIYYSSYRDQLISLYTFVHSIDFWFLSLIHTCPFLYRIS